MRWWMPPGASRSSLPSRGAWIEMMLVMLRVSQCLSLPSRGAWIEIRCNTRRRALAGSLPSRGAWIEMPYNKVPHYNIDSRSPRGERG